MTKTCKICGAKLNQYNLGSLCFPCQEKRKEELEQKIVDNPHYDLDDMCFLLGFTSSESVKRLGRKGIIPGRVPGIKRHLYLREVVNQWIHTGGELADESPDLKNKARFIDLDAENVYSYQDYILKVTGQPYRDRSGVLNVTTDMLARLRGGSS